MPSRASLGTSRSAAVTWLGVVAITAAVVISFRTASMNDFASDDGDPVVPFSILFVVAMLIPLTGVRRLQAWWKLATTQAGVVLVAIITLFAMTPSGDGLYMLPIAMASIATAAFAAMQTLKVRRAPTGDLTEMVASGTVHIPTSKTRRQPKNRIESNGTVSDLVAKHRR